MAVNDHYDVIIIGSGAGGGTLAHKLAPTGKNDFASRARRLRATGKRTIGMLVPLISKENIRPKKNGMTRAATSCTRILIIMWAATPNFSAAALFRLRKEDFGEIKHPWRRLARLADHLR
jgi:glycine/D-amino acid oxidase-like deaminating enzyme